MKAIKAREGRAELVELPDPHGDGVRIRVASAAICGSDLHMIDMGLVGEATLGHEFAGFLPDGRAVAIEPTWSCRQCVHCRDGDIQLCPTIAERILGVSADGGMAEYCLVPPESIVALPSGLDPSNACTVEPTAIAVHAVRRAGIEAGDRIALIGGGAIGLACGAVAVDRDAHTTMIARHDHQLAAAERLGMTGRRSSDAGLDCFDVVIDAAGAKTTVTEAVRRVRPGGRVLLVGSYWEGADFPVLEICLSEIDLIASSLYDRRSPRAFEEAARLVAETPVLPELLITHRFELDAVDEAFSAAADRSMGSIRVVFEP